VNHDNAITDVPCGSILIGERHRKDMGDLGGLAASIAQEGLLQPIGITEDNVLVFGERRLLAIRDVLKRSTISARLVRVSSILAGEFAENEVRKNFTPSERAAIAKAIQTGIGNRKGQRTDLELPENTPEVESVGGPAELRNNVAEVSSESGSVEPAQNFAQVPPGVKTIEFAAKRAGFGNRTTYEQAKKVVEQAVDEIVAQMDSGQLAISSAAIIADEAPERQREIAALPEAEQKEVVRKLRQRDLPTPSEARKLARETGKAILDRKLQWQTGMSPEERKPLIEKSHAIVAVIDAITALTQCPLAAADVAFGIRDLDSPDKDFVGHCRKAAAFLSQIEQELNTHERK
jgi:hypothetical protein